ncbi:MAG: TaqI-like C-terminal specificity domain-containing protein, partial [Wujia sp.]
ADFALGIVTGNNNDYLSKEKTISNEIILKGTDIERYHIREAENYIQFSPEQFQQTASTELYRAKEKLLYRFISNKLIFAYDNRQTLSINSCNILIPRLDGINIKYVLAILNSSVTQFIFRMEFNSVKVLRSHLESLPIPAIDNHNQSKIISLVDEITANYSTEKYEKLYARLDQIVFELFHLTPEEQAIIQSGNNIE